MLFLAALNLASIRSAHCPLLVQWITGWHAHTPAWHTWILGATWAAFILGLFGFIRHSRSICQDCITKWPLNAEEEAATSKRQLQFAIVHAADEAGGSPRARFRRLAVVALVFLMLPTGWPIDIIGALYIMINAAGIWAVIGHARLQPWCPKCRKRGGEDEKADVPAPAVSA